MLQQDYLPARSVHHFYAQTAECLSVLAYKSTAVMAPTDADIQELLRSAQSRNKAEGLTGVLLYDRGTFFQWLEGPAEALARVWNSISRDTRHREIKVLREEPIGNRVFEGWDLRVVLRSAGSVDAAIAALDSPSAVFKRVIGKPQSIIDLSWDDLFSSIVIPRLSELHGREACARISTAAIWHAELDCGAKLASVLMSSRYSDSRRFVNTLLDQGANFNALYHEVFEPAQLCLGELWDDDRCDDFHLTVGLARLQLELRRVNAALAAEHESKPNHSVLLCSQPREPHSVGLLMSTEAFHRRGWDVDCEFPADNESLNEMVHGHWFDVLKLSQSGSLRRDSRLASMRTTIDAARCASLNPALIVMVDGRTFAERPEIYLAVHANAMGASALGAVSVAEKLLATSRRAPSVTQ